MGQLGQQRDFRFSVKEKNTYKITSRYVPLLCSQGLDWKTVLTKVMGKLGCAASRALLKDKCGGLLEASSDSKYMYMNGITYLCTLKKFINATE